MTTLTLEHDTLAKEVTLTRDALVVNLNDGRRLSAPIVWFPRLLNGTRAERSNFELIGEGVGIHWPDLDEDISVEGLLAGRSSKESPASLRKWLDSRSSRRGGKKHRVSRE
ncbi:MAG: DUF2442 domain-containing protein [Planctomycetota bacterium]